MLTSNDLKILVKKGIKPELVKQQLANFTHGFPFIRLEKPATPGNGIRVFEQHELEHFIHLFKSSVGGKKVVKFVPASGAATRMFKDLYDYLNDWRSAKDASPGKAVTEFFNSLNQFAFWPDLMDAIAKKGHDIEQLVKNKNFTPILLAFLEADGLNYGNLPKGLLKFHKYEHGSRTPLEEHLVEAVHYAKDGQGVCRLHFTVSPEHESAFRKKLDSVRHSLERQLNVRFEVEFSIQKPSTDIVAADGNNQPLRDVEGNLVFRPGGHGALLENLNTMEADLIFIKNIDNVVPDHLKEDTYNYKMALGGLLLEVTQQIHEFGKNLQSVSDPSSELITQIMEYLKNNFGWAISDISAEEPSLREILLKELRKPVRVCGMVKNQGEPGGGPYWVSGPGGLSLQVVESSQVNLSDPKQKKIFEQATHFNPVDLVCAVKDWHGNHLDLHSFRDPDTGFIAAKSKDGVEIKAQELPGLWNGSMAFWHTVFVEVPLSTFNPVKTVNDLLRPSHQ